ncbi:hypothetical protein CC78DRAFT_621734 [Lojkania enalia]|uniref:Ribosome assembly protein 3 n=1 Tax=Lojkania enalia TaxID=147567 RepID=A0A9P4JXX9_9PLEO|nr:hypothetical protein CC78DRAFT_621734 [Didymosphaeria enalia]
MAGSIISSSALSALKKKRARRKKSRTEVLSSDSESDVIEKKNRKNKTATPINVANGAKATKSTSKSAIGGSQHSNGDASISSAQSSTSPLPATTATAPKPVRRDEDFSDIYLRKITAELADDLDQVRNANDFTNRSLPMLVHALKQGESIYSPEEKKRVMSGLEA